MRQAYTSCGANSNCQAAEANAPQHDPDALATERAGSPTALTPAGTRQASASPVRRILALQRSAGNAAVAAIMRARRSDAHRDASSAAPRDTEGAELPGATVSEARALTSTVRTGVDARTLAKLTLAERSKELAHTSPPPISRQDDDYPPSNSHKTIPLVPGKFMRQAEVDLATATARGSRFDSSHIRQGQVNNCYLLAALISLAQSPAGQALLNENVSGPDPDGTYHVRLFLRPDPNGAFVARIIQVPPRPGQQASRRDALVRRTSWVDAVVRAYAILYGGRQITESEAGGTLIGGAQRALEHLTGSEADRITNFDDAERLWIRLHEAVVRRGLPVTAGTSQRADTPENHALGIYGFHNYAITGLSGEGGNRMVRLRNPWGHRRRGEPRSPAQYEISFQHFRSSFVTISIGLASGGGGESSGISGSSSPTDESIDRGRSQDQWESSSARLQVAIEESDHPRALRELGRLIRILAPSISPPQPLQHRQIERLRLSLNDQASSHDPTQVDAATSFSFAFEEQSDYWRWIVFTPLVISETRSATIARIEHELQHCADIARDLEAYVRTTESPSTSGFRHFALERRSRSQREMRAYVRQSQSIVEWTHSEQLDWIAGALSEVPANLPESQTLPIEEQVVRLYAQTPSLQPRIVRELYEATAGAVNNASALNRPDAIGRAITILNHFRGIWDRHRPERRICVRAVQRVRAIESTAADRGQ